MPNYGIWQEKDLALDALASGVDRDALLDAQRETLATHNAEINTFLSIFTDNVDQPQRGVATGGDNDLQPLDENGRPFPVKAPGHLIVGFPLRKAGTAEGWNFWTHEQMTIRQLADSYSLMLKGDVKWMRKQLLAAAFYSGAGYTYVNPQTGGTGGESFTVYGLANADATIYDASGGAATDTHYLAQAAAIADATNPFPTIYNDLIEHPQNTGSRIVSFVAPANAAAIRGLASFAPATPNIIQAVPAVGAATIDPQTAPGLGLNLPRSMTYLGIVENTYIVQWQNMPTNYLFTVAIDSTEKPIGLRQYVQSSLRGFVNIGEPMARFPYQQNNFVRAAGFGGLNRIAGHVTYVGVSGTYAAPTGLAAPVA